MLTNYHCHTDYCDGKKPVAEVVAAAKAKGMIALGISSHAPLPFENKWSMKPDALGDYLADINKEKQNAEALQIYSGLEVDFIPGKISPLMFKDKLDYTIGSVHFVQETWEIDNTFDVFMDGLTNLFNGSIRDAIARYYELTREMVNTTPPDIVGHMDKVKMHNRGDRFFQEDEPWYREQVDLTLAAIKNAGCVIEVNTRGLYQNKTDTTYPSPWVLQEICKRNIPITLSSDAHHPDDLTNRFPETARQLISIGFKKLRILLNGKWVDQDFTNYPMA